MEFPPSYGKSGGWNRASQSRKAAAQIRLQDPKYRCAENTDYGAEFGFAGKEQRYPEPYAGVVECVYGAPQIRDNVVKERFCPENFYETGSGMKDNIQLQRESDS